MNSPISPAFASYYVDAVSADHRRRAEAARRASAFRTPARTAGPRRTRSARRRPIFGLRTAG